MTKITTQQAVNYIASQIEAGAQQSVKEGTYTCLYRGPNGAKCFIGMFIPDHVYTEELDSAPGALFNRLPEEIRNLFEDNFPGYELQRIHDRWEKELYPPWKQHVKNKLLQFCTEYKLNPSEVNKIKLD